MRTVFARHSIVFTATMFYVSDEYFRDLETIQIQSCRTDNRDLAEERNEKAARRIRASRFFDFAIALKND